MEVTNQFLFSRVSTLSSLEGVFCDLLCLLKNIDMITLVATNISAANTIDIRIDRGEKISMQTVQTTSIILVKNSIILAIIIFRDNYSKIN